MTIRVFDPKSVEVGPIGPMMAAKTENPGLKAFFESKSGEDGDGNLSAIVIGDSQNMGVGVGTWDAGQFTKEPIPIGMDECLWILQGSLYVTSNDQTHHAKQGECIHIAAGSLVHFKADEDCRLVWVTSPPTWVAFERIWEEKQQGG